MREEVPLDDSALVRAARSGRHAAFDELVRRHQRAALQVATAVAGSSRAADAAQEGFVRAFRKLHQFDDTRGTFRAWLLRIVANAARNELRRLDRHRKIDMTVASLAVAGPEDDPGAALARHQEVGDAMAALSADDRLILGLRWWAELTEAEMADVLAVARGTVKSRLSRAMTRLRAELEEEAADA